MASDLERCWSRNVLCALRTGGKYFAKLIQNRCESTKEGTLYNVLQENIYKHDILHLWRNEKCCLCGVRTKHRFCGTLTERQILLIYLLTDTHCCMPTCKLCPKSYTAKTGVSSTQLDITFSHALLKRIFLTNCSPELEKVRDAMDEIKGIRNTHVHGSADSIHNTTFDQDWLKLKKNLLIICEYLKEPKEQLEEEMEQFQYAVNRCTICSNIIKKLLMKSNDQEEATREIDRQRIDGCPQCAELQQGNPDAYQIIYKNFDIFMGIAPNEFLPDLKDAGVLTDTDVRNIESEEKRGDQMKTFLSILKVKGCQDCRKTLDILSVKQYGPAIREMRKTKTNDSGLSTSVSNSIKDTVLYSRTQSTEEKTEGTEGRMEGERPRMKLSISGKRKEHLEEALENSVLSNESLTKLDEMRLKVDSTEKSSVIINFSFDKKEDYEYFQKSIGNEGLFEYVSWLWENLKHDESIADGEACMIVHVQGFDEKIKAAIMGVPTGGSADFFIDVNEGFLLEELCPGTLIEHLRENGHQIDDIWKTRIKEPFNRHLQAQMLLMYFRNKPFQFFKDCMSSTQTQIVKRKIEEFASSLKISSSEANSETESDVVKIKAVIQGESSATEKPALFRVRLEFPPDGLTNYEYVRNRITEALRKHDEHNETGRSLLPYFDAENHDLIYVHYDELAATMTCGDFFDADPLLTRIDHDKKLRSESHETRNPVVCIVDPTVHKMSGQWEFLGVINNTTLDKITDMDFSRTTFRYMLDAKYCTEQEKRRLYTDIQGTLERKLSSLLEFIQRQNYPRDLIHILENQYKLLREEHRRKFNMTNEFKEWLFSEIPQVINYVTVTDTVKIYFKEGHKDRLESVIIGKRFADNKDLEFIPWNQSMKVIPFFRPIQICTDQRRIGSIALFGKLQSNSRHVAISGNHVIESGQKAFTLNGQEMEELGMAIHPHDQYPQGFSIIEITNERLKTFIAQTEGKKVEIFKGDKKSLERKKVMKYGAGSGRTVGYVLDASIYGGDFSLGEMEGILIEGESGCPFAQPGDSGALVYIPSRSKITAVSIVFGTTVPDEREQTFTLKFEDCKIHVEKEMNDKIEIESDHGLSSMDDDFSSMRDEPSSMDKTVYDDSGEVSDKNSELLLSSSEQSSSDVMS